MKNAEVIQRRAGAAGLQRPLVEHRGNGRGYWLWAFVPMPDGNHTVHGVRGDYVLVADYPALYLAGAAQVQRDVLGFLQDYPAAASTPEKGT